MIYNCKTSHTEQMRTQYAYNTMQVLYLTGINDERLSKLQFTTGMDWLAKYTDCDAEMLQWILSQPIVWKWWLNEWNRRDMEYLPMLYSIYEWNRKEVIHRYMAFHFSCFVEMTFPWRILEDGYARAMGELTDKSITV